MAVRQLITRIDDDLHQRLKQRAAAEGKSVNALVSAVLRQAVAADDERARVRIRLDGLGRRVSFPRPRRVPSMKAVLESTKGAAGRIILEALEEDRRHR